MARGRLVIKADRCKGCELCASVCPKKILEIDNKVLNHKGYHPIGITSEEECIGCGNCGIMCPDGVINVYRES
ncbi:MAG: 4Fe-4S binding protein [Firmicutes bacterium]|nr:4Fe-4S binding protein [Bacillota bacterium]